MGPLPLIAAKHQSSGPENVLPQWQQKIAQMRKKCHPATNGLTIWTCFIFRTKCDFLQVLDLHIFRQVARLLMPVPLPFSPSYTAKIEKK